MAIINVALRADGNPAVPAVANISPGTGGYLGLLTQLQVNAELFDTDGNSLGIQGLDYTLDGSEPFWNADLGGARASDLMLAFCNAISAGWSPGVKCWRTVQVAGTEYNPAYRDKALQGFQSVNFHIQPVGQGVELVRIRDWIFVPTAPVPS